MTVDKVIAKIIWLTFFGPPCRVDSQFVDVRLRVCCNVA